jgi:hypothetical protein
MITIWLMSVDLHILAIPANLHTSLNRTHQLLTPPPPTQTHIHIHTERHTHAHIHEIILTATDVFFFFFLLLLLLLCKNCPSARYTSGANVYRDVDIL